MSRGHHPSDVPESAADLIRRLELASGLFLDEVHEILQVAFGWTGSHLHQFASGPRYHGPETEYYPCPYQVEEGVPGVPEEEVRLDEVIADPGDTLCYVYDFGDNWEHVISLEAVAPWDDAAPAACLDGMRDGPPEDCGGLGGYELISAAVDPLNPDHGDAVIEFERMYGMEFHADSNGLNPFRIEVINAEGLLRKLRGMPLLTAAGRKLRGDQVSLWWNLAERMPPRSADRCETQAGLIWLLAVAAQRPGDPGPGDPAEIVARILAGIGWKLAGGTPLSALNADRAAWDTRNVLRCLGGLADDPHRYGAGPPDADGVVFARTAVSSWPVAVTPR